LDWLPLSCRPLVAVPLTRGAKKLASITSIGTGHTK
jgi:hypothetical protein